MLAVALLLAPNRALAHAFGARYDLPIPLSLWIAGAGAVVAVTFLLLALFVRREQRDHGAWRLDIGALPGLGALAHPMVRGLLRGLSLALFALIVVVGLWGPQTTIKNLAPVLVWVIWWVGMAYLAALFGDLWRLVNPWNVAFGAAESVFGLAGRRVRRYPPWLGAWPAVALFLGFAWLEIVSESGELPARLSTLILAYSALTWSGMYLFGRETWLDGGEAFHLCFGLLARFGITEARRPSDARAPRWLLRPPGVGLLVERPMSVSMVAFVVLLLATVSFDGISETPFWASVLEWFAESRGLRPLLLALQGSGVNLAQAIKTLGLVATPLIFLAVYLLICRLALAAAGSRIGLGDTAGYFVLSLVPIAIAYHLAHYFSYLMLAGQLAIPLASDPLGLGWDLFGSADYAIEISVVSARMVWYLATAAIVTGHVFAVYLGHVMALKVFGDAGRALRSQAPVLVLMVGYSMLSLWILSQPVVAPG